MSGAAAAPASVKWTVTGSSTGLSSGNVYTVAEGSYVSGAQTMKLTVAAPSADATYTCTFKYTASDEVTETAAIDHLGERRG